MSAETGQCVTRAGDCVHGNALAGAIASKLLEVFMAALATKLNPLERIIFGSALVLGAVLIVVRLGTFALLWLSHHLK